MSTQSPTLTSSARQYIRMHLPMFTDLLDAGEFYLEDQSEAHQQIQSLKMMGLVEKVKRERHFDESWGTDGYTIRHVWTLTPKAKDEVRDRLEHMDSLPCDEGHTAFETITPGETYRCKSCGTEHDYATVAAFLGVQE